MLAFVKKSFQKNFQKYAFMVKYSNNNMYADEDPIMMKMLKRWWT